MFVQSNVIELITQWIPYITVLIDQLCGSIFKWPYYRASWVNSVFRCQSYYNGILETSKHVWSRYCIVFAKCFLFWFSPNYWYELTCVTYQHTSTNVYMLCEMVSHLDTKHWHREAKWPLKWGVNGCVCIIKAIRYVSSLQNQHKSTTSNKHILYLVSEARVRRW